MEKKILERKKKKAALTKKQNKHAVDIQVVSFHLLSHSKTHLWPIYIRWACPSYFLS